MTELAATFVMDTSVLINLHACGLGIEVLHAIPNEFVVTTNVAAELEHETSRRSGDHEFLQTLVGTGKVSLIELDEAESEIFVNLISVAPTLGDGEAATIAVAQVRNHTAVIDERRGRSRAAALMPQRIPNYSLDLFLHTSTLASLGESRTQEALFLALRDGRMRIPAQRADEVVSLLGDERARQCTSLPGYKARFSDMHQGTMEVA